MNLTWPPPPQLYSSLYTDWYGGVKGVGWPPPPQIAGGHLAGKSSHFAQTSDLECRKNALLRLIITKFPREACSCQTPGGHASTFGICARIRLVSANIHFLTNMYDPPPLTQKAEYGPAMCIPPSRAMGNGHRSSVPPLLTDLDLPILYLMSKPCTQLLKEPDNYTVHI